MAAVHDPFGELSDDDRKEEERRLEKLRKASEEDDSSDEEAAYMRPPICTATRLGTGTCFMSSAELQHLFVFLWVIKHYNDEAEDQKVKANQAWHEVVKTGLLTKPDFEPCHIARRWLPSILKKDYTPLNVLGAGINGIALRVYAHAFKRDYALKISVAPHIVAQAGPESEVKMQNKLAKLGLAPRALATKTFVLNSGTRHRVDMIAILMEEMALSLEQKFLCAQTLKEVLAVCDSINRVLLALNKFKITHGDTHLGNGMYATPTTPTLSLIDFGNTSVDVFFPQVDHAHLMRDLWILQDEEATPVELTDKIMKKMFDRVFANVGVVDELWKVRMDYDKVDALHDKYLDEYKRRMKAFVVKQKQKKPLENKPAGPSTRSKKGV